MAMIKKKGAKKPPAKPPRGAVKKAPPKKPAPSVLSLQRELAEAREQQNATSEILRMIAGSPGDLQSVMDAIAENAARLCDADDALVRRLEGDRYYAVSHFGSIPTVSAIGVSTTLDRSTPAGRAVVDRETVHVHDLRVAVSEYPGAQTRGLKVGVRTALAAPLLRDGQPIGSIHIRRLEVRPFTDAQIRLLETFADQAVIAIENARLFNELKDSLEQQTATSEILGVIASSPTDVQPVLDVVAENAAKLCEATDATILQVEGDVLRFAASFGSLARIAERRPLGRATPSGRAILDRQTIHVRDLQEQLDEFPAQARTGGLRGGVRTLLATPLYRERVPIGAIVIRRTEVRPFSEKQIALLKTFADQAVIAIENVRLFRELGERNAELREALEHQTATAEVLGIISRSPTDVQPVLDAIVESAAKVCGIDDVVLRFEEGNTLVPKAHFGPLPAVAHVEISIDAPQLTWMREHGALHVPDILAQNEFPTLGTGGVARTLLIVPLCQKGELVGTLSARRTEVRPFTPAQIKLLETFADQAVIAIENTRLLKELQDRNDQLTESLEQQTATSEILRVIASSPTDIQPVLDTVAESAARLCEASDAQIMRLEGEFYRRVAAYGTLPALDQLPLNRGSPSGRSMVDRQTIHVDDLAAEVENEYPELKAYQQRLGHRTTLATPLLREGAPIGAILIRRLVVRPFSPKQIALLKIFADQAVIAIENVRLFKELGERNAELREALEHQTATSEVLSIISRSPTDVQPVLDAIVESAARVCGIDDVVLRLREGEYLTVRAHVGAIAPGPAQRGIDEAHYRWIREHGALHAPDVSAQTDFPTLGLGTSTRTFLVVPLRQHGELIGVLGARRIEVRPFTPAQIKLMETFADQAVIALENVRLFNELKESLEQQTATSEILGVIASSPTEIQPVLETITGRAARVCGAEDGVLRLVDGSVMRLAAHYGSVPGVAVERPINRQSPPGRAVLDRAIIHIANDVAVIAAEYPEVVEMLRTVSADAVTVLAVPLVREDVAIGVIHFRRLELRPFSEKQIALLKTFADQAVIAIENVRLFKELGDRNVELREALEHQTATAAVLGIISRSPTDVQPVLDAIVESAARVCGIDDVVLRLREENSLVLRAHFGPIRVRRVDIPIDGPQLVWMREHGTLHVPDRLEQDDIPRSGFTGNWRSLLSVPLRQQGELVGVLAARRLVVHPFTTAQIKLLETFADQAVIAIENVRLFKELEERNRQITEALEQQTATSEILRVIASSPTDIQLVLDVVAENAARLCEASNAAIFRTDGAVYWLVALHGSIPIPRSDEPRPLTRSLPIGRAMIDREVVHIEDLTKSEFLGHEFRLQDRVFPTVLNVPLLREGIAIGAIHVRRQEVRPFSEKQIILLKTFADQAVIAIENVRLFKELQERNSELREALQHQTATSEVLSIISRSPTDVQPVLDAIGKFQDRCRVD